MFGTRRLERGAFRNLDTFDSSCKTVRCSNEINPTLMTMFSLHSLGFVSTNTRPLRGVMSHLVQSGRLVIQAAFGHCNARLMPHHLYDDTKEIYLSSCGTSVLMWNRYTYSHSGIGSRGCSTVVMTHLRRELLSLEPSHGKQGVV